MKTLDEVIKALEIPKAISEWNEVTLDSEACDDALHYLSEYRSCKHLQEIWQQEAEKCKETREKFTVLYKEYMERINSIEPPNVPLTWDELRKMESKPIWIEQNMMIDSGTKDEYRQTKKEWVIVVSVDNRTAYLMSAEDGELCFVRAEYFDNPDLTDYWQAYRKERL